MPAAQRLSREAPRTWRERPVRCGSAISRSPISAGRPPMVVSGFAVDEDSGVCRCDVEGCSTKATFPEGHPQKLLDDYHHVVA
jgi:hypothetical protein